MKIKRKGTKNNIEWLAEETYKELFEKVKAENAKLKAENEELKIENEIMHRDWKQLMKDTAELISIRKNIEDYIDQQ